MTFEELYDEYMELYSLMQSQSEVKNKNSRFANHISPTIGTMNLKDIKLKHCQTIVNNMIAKKGLAPKTAKNVKVVMQVVFKYAYNNDYVEGNPADLVKIPKFDNKYNIHLTPDQISRLIINVFHWYNEKYRLIFIFGLHGRRLKEILTLQWEQIDFSTRTYSIPPQKNKSRRDDVFGMTGFLFDSLYSFYEKEEKKGLTKNKHYLFKSPKATKKSKNGKKIKDDNAPFKDIRRTFGKLKKLSGIDKMRFHDLRHLLGTESVKKGVPVEHICQALGHSSVAVTEKYITRDPHIAGNVVNVYLGDYLNEYIPSQKMQ